MAAVPGRERKPRLQAGFSFLMLALACAGIHLARGEAQATEELESSASVFPETLGAGRRRALALVRSEARIHEGCSKPAPGYKLKGTRIGRRRMDFFVDSSSFPAQGASSSQAIFEAVRLAAQTWSSQGPSVPRLVGRKAADPAGAAFALDGRNTVSWGSISPFAADTLAAIQLLVDSRRNRVLEFDVLLNDNAPWAVLRSTEEAPGSSAGPFDVQNAMTHVFGHILGLAGISGEENCASSMYHRIAPNETTKRRLSLGDRAALRRLYP
ncbi:MAG TPA: hypothetical protein DEB40_05840 [Elusimicrobia bacterium]|nr:hypothetical protein [Elusimicrobiota bacterium]HBT61247.1 hypothetical protein [Elusimicrobiota bacterium]